MGVSGTGDVAINCAGNAIEYEYDNEAGAWGAAVELSYQWNTNTAGRVFFLIDTGEGFTCAFIRMNGAACLEVYKDFIDSFPDLGVEPALSDPFRVCFG
mmetsp:Transcript_18438/g.53165  ORF Transcript_18438/g.53165 Transcript_18438/m.53165 type:complete len:99 (-) Transcript_18438:302-598(-)